MENTVKSGTPKVLPRAEVLMVNVKSLLAHSETHLIVWIGWDLKDHLVSTPAIGRDTAH